MKQFFEKNLKGGGLFKQPRKKLLIILLILIIICGAIGISYAYSSLTLLRKQNPPNPLFMGIWKDFFCEKNCVLFTLL